MIMIDFDLELSKMDELGMDFLDVKIEEALLDEKEITEELVIDFIGGYLENIGDPVNEIDAQK
jgi:hypothetical protein